MGQAGTRMGCDRSGQKKGPAYSYMSLAPSISRVYIIYYKTLLPDGSFGPYAFIARVGSGMAYCFLLSLNYVFSLLTYYFFKGCQVEMTLAKTASRQLNSFFLLQFCSAQLAALAIALAGCRCALMYS